MWHSILIGETIRNGFIVPMNLLCRCEYHCESQHGVFLCLFSLGDWCSCKVHTRDAHIWCSQLSNKGRGTSNTTHLSYPSNPPFYPSPPIPFFGMENEVLSEVSGSLHLGGDLFDVHFFYGQRKTLFFLLEQLFIFLCDKVTECSFSSVQTLCWIDCEIGSLVTHLCAAHF